MKASLQIVVDALARAGLVIEGPPAGNGRGLPEITGLTADARRLERGMLYCALRGAVLDGHRFVPDAVARGAVAALVEVRQPVNIPQGGVRNGPRAAAVAGRSGDGPPAG